MDEYLEKLKIVLNLILKDIPDKYDDTINSKLLDSIEHRIKSDVIVVKFLKDFLEKTFQFNEFYQKDIEIQMFLLNLISILYKNEIFMPDFNQKLIEFIQKNVLDESVPHLEDTSMRFTVLSLLNLMFNTNKIEKSFLQILRDLFLKRDLLGDASLYIRKLSNEMMQKYFSEFPNEIEELFTVFISKSTINSLDLLKFLVDKRLINSILNNGFVKLIESHLFDSQILTQVDMHSIDSFTSCWFKFKALNKNDESKFASDLEELIVELIQSNKNQMKFTLINKIFNRIYDEVDGFPNLIRSTFHLQFSPMNYFSSQDEDKKGYLRLLKFNEFKALFKSTLINLIHLFQKTSFSIHFKLYSNPEVVQTVLYHFNLELNIKQNFLKILNILLAKNFFENEDEVYDILFMLINDIKVNEGSSESFSFNEDLLNTVKLLINKENFEEDNVLIGKLNEHFKMAAQNKNLDTLETFFSFLISLTTPNEKMFLKELIINERDLYLSYFTEAIFNSDGSSEDSMGLINLKINVLKLVEKMFEFNEFSEIMFTHFNSSQLFKVVLSETEAFMRRDLVTFLNKLYQLQLSHNKQSSEVLNEQYFKSYSKLLLQDFDWDSQINTLHFIDNYFLINFSQSDEELMRFISSDLFLTIVDLYQNELTEKLVKEKITQVFLNLKNNDLLCSILSKNLNLNTMQHKFYHSIDVHELNKSLKVLREHADIYLSNPVNILDDIISSYEYNFNEGNQITDCY